MATTDKTPPDRRVTFGMTEEGVLVAQYTWQTYRFMFSDGSTVDVSAARDDSDLRAAVLAHTGAAMIVGVARITPPPPAPVTAAKKRPTKRATAKP